MRGICNKFDQALATGSYLFSGRYQTMKSNRQIFTINNSINLKEYFMKYFLLFVRRSLLLQIFLCRKNTATLPKYLSVKYSTFARFVARRYVAKC